MLHALRFSKQSHDSSDEQPDVTTGNKDEDKNRKW